jgi:hypothetical protein
MNDSREEEQGHAVGEEEERDSEFGRRRRNAS